MTRFVLHFRANAVGYVALFLALGGGAYAAATAPKDSVVSRSIRDGQVKSADLRNGGVRGRDVDEASLGQVPSAKVAESAADADRLAGLPAVSLQRRVSGICAAGKAISSIESANVGCSSPVFPIDLTSPTGNSRQATFGASELRLIGTCSAGAPKVSFANDGPGAATLNWFFSEGGAATTVNASGNVIAAGGSLAFNYGGRRMEGRFVFADGAGVTTVNLHAFDGGTSCEVLGTAQFARGS